MPGQPFAPLTIPEGASFKNMVALKGKPDIGDQINKKIIGPLASANKLSDMPDFNDATKLGSGKEMVDRLTNLIAIFENKALDFSKNRADGDDILGDAYEYLMRNFTTESGKSKGQFYTPAEVSRIIAQILGIRNTQTSADTTVYDPTCGSGSGERGGFKLEDPETLFTEWAENYYYRKNDIQEFYSAKSVTDIEKAVFEYCYENKIPYDLFLSIAFKKRGILFSETAVGIHLAEDPFVCEIFSGKSCCLRNRHGKQFHRMRDSVSLSYFWLPQPGLAANKSGEYLRSRP